MLLNDGDGLAVDETDRDGLKLMDDVSDGLADFDVEPELELVDDDERVAVRELDVETDAEADDEELPD